MEGSHLLRVHDTGTAVLNETDFVYAAMEMPDDDVSEIASRRGIDLEEAKNIVRFTAGALEYLHSRGLRHGGVRPANILVASGTFKLSADTLAVADEATRTNDLRDLGATITEMMTGDTSETAINHLPVPLRQAAICCFQSPTNGCTASRVVQTITEGESPTAAQDGSTAVDTSEFSPIGLLRQRWPVFALAAACLCAVAFLASRKPAAPESAATPMARQQPLPMVEKPTPSIVQQTRQPTATSESAERAAPVRANRANSWAVIAATYAKFEPAQKRLERLHQRSANLEGHVYPPPGRDGPYYVVLGSGLSSHAAHKLRNRAVRLGAPRDTYVTRLRER